MQKQLAVALTIFVAVALSAVALAQTAGFGTFSAFVVEVTQDVPIVVSIPVTLDSGEVVTATAPLTVSVNLQVRVEGPQQAVVARGRGLRAPEVVVATATPAPDTGGMYILGEDVIVGDIRWRILAAEDMGNLLESDNQFTNDLETTGKFVRVQFEIENQGRESKTFTDIQVVDSEERAYDQSRDTFSFIPDEEECFGYDQLNPNITKSCTMFFEVAADATGLRAYVGDLETIGDDEAYIELGL